VRILIAGAGVTGRRLVGELSRGRNEVVVIDLNRDLCEAISAELGVVAIHGNATDIATLDEAGISRVDVAIGLMRSSADNLAFSLLARGAGVKRVIARMPNPKYRAAYERAGVTTILDVAGMFIDRLVFEIERPPVHQIAAIADGQGAIVWVTVADGSGVCNRPLEEVRADRRFPAGCIVAGLIRKDDARLILPSGRDRLLPGDRVLLVGTTAGLVRAADLFGQKRSIASILLRPRGEKEDVQARIDASEEGGSEARED